MTGAGDARRHRVLVVDDDPVLRLIMTVNLEAEGMEVVVAADSATGFEAALATLPDLIVLDVMLPDCEGLTTLGRLKAEPRTRDIPAVILSARASESEQLEGWLAGADHYLTKPFDVDEVVAYLRGVLRDLPTRPTRPRPSGASWPGRSPGQDERA